MKDDCCEQLEDYFDDCLTADERPAFEQHLKNCLSCQSRLQQMSEIEDLICDAWSEVTIPFDLKPEASLATVPTGVVSVRNKRAIAWTSLTGLASAIVLTLFLTNRSPEDSKRAAVSQHQSIGQDGETQPVAFYESGDNGTLISPVVSTAEFTIVKAFPVSTSINLKSESAK